MRVGQRQWRGAALEESAAAPLAHVGRHGDGTAARVTSARQHVAGSSRGFKSVRSCPACMRAARCSCIICMSRGCDRTATLC